jgi:chromosome partitioning protein
MRGRRRGRNRPSSESLPAEGSGPESSSGSQGSVKVIEAVAGDESDTPVDDTPAVVASTDSPVANSPHTDSPTAAVSVGDADHGVDPPTPAIGDSPLPDGAADTGSGAVRATVTDPSAEPVTDSGAAGSDAVEPDAAAAEVTPAAEEKPEAEAAPAGRQFQSAAGNPLPRVLAVANQKGGVGKTTTSVNLGAALAELGFRVLVIDLDPQGNATTGLGIDARNFELSMYDVLMRDCSLEDCVEPTSMKNLFVAPATIALAGAEIELVPAFSRELKLRRAIESVIDDFDYVLIDCPPSLGLITVNALAAASEVLVPIQCEYYALEGLSQLMRNVHLVASNLNPRLDISTIVLTMYDARTKLADQVATEVREHFGPKVCRIVIPRTVRLSEAPSFGQPITAFDPASRGAIAYRELAKEVSGGTS